MQTIAIRSDADFVAFCKSPQSARLEFAVNRIALPATGVTLQSRNIEIAGETAPSGRLLMTGGRFTLLNCESIAVSGVGFRSQRIADPVKVGLFETYERSHKPFAIHSSSTVTPSRNIALRTCSFSGHADEIEIGPADHADWFARFADKPASIDVTLDRIMFGPSFINTGETIKDANARAEFLNGKNGREFHNMGLSVPCVDGLTMTGCVFVGNNRRSPQVQGKRIKLAHCVVDDFGSMGVGIHAGSDVAIQACHFIRGPHTSPAERGVSFVEGTWASPFANLGPVTLGISSNCREYDRNFGILRRGWDVWQEPASAKWVKSQLGNVPIQSIAEIANQAGCGDSLDTAIRVYLAGKKHVPWLRNYEAPFLMPK